MLTLFSVFGNGNKSDNEKILDSESEYINEYVEENKHNGCEDNDTRIDCSDDDIELIESDEDCESDANDSFSHVRTVKKEMSSKQNSWRIHKELYKREIGLYDRCKKWSDAFCQTEDVVKKLSISKELKGHKRRVNCIDFNLTGNLIASGSKDCQLALWNWSKGVCIWRSFTKHIRPIRNVKHMNHLAAVCLLSSGEDGYIIRHFVANSGKSYSKIILHNVRGHIAVQKDDAYVFLTCLRNGTITNIDLREKENSRTLLYNFSNAERFPMRIDSIDINPMKPYEFIMNGNDHYVIMFDKRRMAKGPLKKFRSNDIMYGSDLKSLQHIVNRDQHYYYPDMELNKTAYYEPSIVSAVYNYSGMEILASYNSGDIYLFDVNGPQNKILHRYSGHVNAVRTGKSVSFYGPRSEYLLSGSDNGYIYVWNKQTEAIVLRHKAIMNKPVNVIKGNPSNPMLATCGWEKAIKIWEPIGVR